MSDLYVSDECGQSVRMGDRLYLREWRKFRGLVQQDVAAALNCTNSAVSKMELRKLRVKEFQIRKIANLFQCSIEDLYHLPGDEKLTNAVHPRETGTYKPGEGEDMEDMDLDLLDMLVATYGPTKIMKTVRERNLKGPHPERPLKAGRG